MLNGAITRLRPVREDDLDRLYERHHDLESRGEFFPLGVASQPAFRDRFAQTGPWSNDEGMLVMVGDDGAIVGHVEFYPTVAYFDELELSQQVYDPERRGRGIATEAVRLTVRYLFDTKRFGRIRLVIHPDNVASRRLAERCGFRHEGTARRAWFHRGRRHDVEIYAVVRDEGTLPLT